MRPRTLYLLVCGAFIAGRGWAHVLGMRFDDTPLEFYWQFLDSDILRHDLLRGVLDLHAQPPLFQLFVGGVLKLFPGHATSVFAAAYAAAGLLTLLAIAWLIRRLAVPAALAATATALLALHPEFLICTGWLFYTLPVAFLLAASGVALARFIDSGRAAPARLFAWLGAAVMLTRSVFHPLWFVAALAVVAPTLDLPRRRALLRAAVAPLLLVNLWCAKNLLQVGTYGTSSWLGMNLAKGWVGLHLPRAGPLAQALATDPVLRVINEGLLDRAGVEALAEDARVPAVWARGPFRRPEVYRDLGYFRAGEAGHPALSAPLKRNGEANFNHRDYARISHAMLAGDLAAMRDYPDRYLQRVVAAVGGFLDPGPPAVLIGTYDVDRLRRVWSRWTAVLLASGGPLAAGILFSAALGFGLVRARPQGPSKRDDMRPLLAYLAVTVLWVTGCVNLIEIGETERMRWEIDPLWLVLLAYAAASLLGALRERDR